MQPLRILIAEDEAVIAMLLGEVLHDMGHNICATVSTADEVIAAAQEHQPELMIIDPGLQDSSGILAVSALTKLRAVPHIFMTGNVASVLAAMPDAIVIEKPFDEAQLIDAIERALGVRTA